MSTTTHPTAHRLQRLLRPASICLFGSGWAENVAYQLAKAGYAGQVTAVHPHRPSLGGVPCVRSIADLPLVPDACFVGLNRTASVNVVQQLAALGAGGVVCFASGFQESDLADGADLQAQLVAAAGEMPMLGPNCYGYLNYLDNAPVWPDQHGGVAVEGGVAIIAQSSNIALNLTMQQRGLRIAYVFTLGNQAQTQVSDLIEAMVADERVTCIGLYLEGFGDIPRFYQAALAARAAGKSIVAIKIGKTQKARIATQTHTASMAGAAAASSALLQRLGISEVDTLSVFLDTLKLLDTFGPLTGTAVASISCSGGEAGLMADLAEHSRVHYPDFPASTAAQLTRILGDKVTVANPLDYHTYIWGDVPSMTACFTAILAAPYDLYVFVLDIPRSDRCDASSHDCAIEAISNAARACHAQGQTARIAVLTSLPENLPETTIAQFAEVGVVTLHGVETAMAAISAAGSLAGEVESTLPALAHANALARPCLVDEFRAKQTLAAFGLTTPTNTLVTSLIELDQATGFNVEVMPAYQSAWVLKLVGVAHKTEVGGVRLNLRERAELHQAFAELAEMAGALASPVVGQVLLESYVEAPIVELIVGVTRDPTGLLLLTLGAGGVYAELLNDTAHLLLPTTPRAVLRALSTLKLAPILNGYRGKAAAKSDTIVAAIMAINDYAIAHSERLLSLDINPLMITASAAIAVDALIELTDDSQLPVSNLNPAVGSLSYSSMHTLS